MSSVPSPTDEPDPAIPLRMAHLEDMLSRAEAEIESRSASTEMVAIITFMLIVVGVDVAGSWFGIDVPLLPTIGVVVLAETGLFARRGAKSRRAAYLVWRVRILTAAAEIGFDLKQLSIWIQADTVRTSRWRSVAGCLRKDC